MAYTTGDLVSRVQQRIRDTNYSSSEIKSYLNDALRDVYNEYRLPFMQTTQNYTLVDGVSDITNGSGLPTNYVQAIDLILTTDSRETVLEYQDIRQIDAYHTDPDDTDINPAGVPSKWYPYGSIIKVFPVPDDAYTLTVRYYKSPAELSDDGDVPELPSEFAELLVVGAAYRVLQVKDNYDQAGILENKFTELIQKLVVKYSLPQVGTPSIMRINRRAMGKANY